MRKTPSITAFEGGIEKRADARDDARRVGLGAFENDGSLVSSGTKGMAINSVEAPIIMKRK